MKAAALAAVIAALGTYNGYTIEEILAVTAPLMAYIIGQGAADFGKESEKIKGS